MSSLLTREKKYQFIKLIESGISLTDANLLARIVHTASMRGYMSEKDYNDLNQIIDKLDRFASLLETRKQKKKKILQKYSPSKGEDRIANLFTGMGFKAINKKTDFTRRGILKRRKMPKRAPTRAGSSEGLIGQTKVIGAHRLNKQIDQLAKSLNQMIASFERIGKAGKGARMKASAINDFLGSIRTSVEIKGKR